MADTPNPDLAAIDRRMARDDGGPAFPIVFQADARFNDGSGDSAFVDSTGLSLRDYFAIRAYIPDEIVASAFDTSPSEFEALPRLARWCYAWADAMLEARGK